jgi:poly(3-hydroxybutyrate) depolymerase
MGALSAQKVKITDSRHYSNVFGEIRNFRVFLPPGYDANSSKRYPVIYYYHGWSQRYFGSGSDDYAGVDKDNDNKGDNIASFVAKNDVIVVKPDGYNRSAGEEYYLRPYNVGPVETYRQYPLYFPELVRYIDANYLTVPDRAHRAISGLSMGGFMSFWIGGKYPHLVSAVGNFCGSPEFVVGPASFPVELRHMDMYNNYGGVNVRLNYGNEDFIRYYHRDLNRVWTQVMDNYQFGVYKAAHSTCGLGEMFEFIMKTFKNPPQKPDKWDHTDVYPEFSVWDYDISSDRDVPGFTILENVDQRGFRCSVREHLPDGQLMPWVNVSVTTPPRYEKNISYTINDIEAGVKKPASYELKSDNSGRLTIYFNGRIHDIGINKTGDNANITVASVVCGNNGVALSNSDVSVKIRLLNKGVTKGEGIKATLSATRKSASVIKGEAVFGAILPNEAKASESVFSFRVQSDTIEIEKFLLTVTDKNNNEWKEYFEVPLIRATPEIKEFEIADGRSVTVAKTGESTETVLLGSGNGDGVANPGESIVIMVKELNKLWRTNLIVADKFVNPTGTNTRISDYWGTYDNVGGSAKYSVPVISSACPAGQVIDFYAEYWLPAAPDHIIKKGKISVKVTGRDATPPVLEWVRIPGDNIIQVKLIDGSAVRKVIAKLTLKDKPDKSFEASLRDDGKYGDLAENDNVFSYRIAERRFGLYNVGIIATDSFGNVMTQKSTEVFVLH